MSWTTLLRRKLFALGPEDTSFTTLGAHIDPEQRVGLQAIVESARVGFNLTLEDDRVEDLTERVTAVVEPRFLGFAHEGVGMALTVLDELRDRRRVPRFFERCIGVYDFFVPLGVGFALARIPWTRGSVERRARVLPAPFHSRGVLANTPVPRGLSPDGARCFDHGVGRAIWFMCGGAPERIREALAGFPAARHEDLWAGLGTACAFAGSAHPDEAGYAAVLDGMDAFVGPHRDFFQAGVVVAAELARRTGHPSRWVARACERFLGVTDTEAGKIAERAWAEAHAGGADPAAYATYRKFATAMQEGARAARATRPGSPPPAAWSNIAADTAAGMVSPPEGARHR
jgi:hypothetical protein